LCWRAKTQIPTPLPAIPLLKGEVELADVHRDRRGAEHLEGEDAGLAAGRAQLQALEIGGRHHRPDVVGDVAKADLTEADHLEIGALPHRCAELLADLAVEDLRRRLAVRDQERHVEDRPFRIELDGIGADRDHVELAGAHHLHVDDLVAERTAVEILDRDRIAELLLERVAEGREHHLGGGAGGALDRHLEREIGRAGRSRDGKRYEQRER
jgi:hypothetical protein